MRNVNDKRDKLLVVNNAPRVLNVPRVPFVPCVPRVPCVPL
jgi:hypothetical protein